MGELAGVGAGGDHGGYARSARRRHRARPAHGRAHRHPAGKSLQAGFPRLSSAHAGDVCGSNPGDHTPGLGGGHHLHPPDGRCAGWSRLPRLSAPEPARRVGAARAHLPAAGESGRGHRRGLAQRLRRPAAAHRRRQALRRRLVGLTHGLDAGAFPGRAAQPRRGLAGAGGTAGAGPPSELRWPQRGRARPRRSRQPRGHRGHRRRPPSGESDPSPCQGEAGRGWGLRRGVNTAERNPA